MGFKDFYVGYNSLAEVGIGRGPLLVGFRV